MVELLRKHKKALQDLTLAGVVSPVWLRDLRIAEAYEQLNMDCQMCKYEVLASRFNLNSDSVRKIIRNMKNAK